MVQVTPKSTSNIKIRIAQTGLTLRGFSRKINVSHSYLSQILNEQRKPSPVIASKISSGLNVELVEIFFINLVDEHTKVVEA